MARQLDTHELNYTVHVPCYYLAQATSLRVSYRSRDLLQGPRFDAFFSGGLASFLSFFLTCAVTRFTACAGSAGFRPARIYRRSFSTRELPGRRDRASCLTKFTPHTHPISLFCVDH